MSPGGRLPVRKTTQTPKTERNSHEQPQPASVCLHWNPSGTRTRRHVATASTTQAGQTAMGGAEGAAEAVAGYPYDVPY